MHRRSFLRSLGAGALLAVAAPTIVRASSLMAVKAVEPGPTFRLYGHAYHNGPCQFYGQSIVDILDETMPGWRGRVVPFDAFA